MYTVDRLKKKFQLEHVRANAGAFPEFQINSFELQDCIKAGERSGHGCIFKGHQPPSRHNLIILETFFEKMVLNVRDPRQALLSWINNVEHMRDDVYSRLMGIPHEYFDWSWETKLDWQIDNYFQLQIDWLDQWWKCLLEKKTKFEIILTRFEDLKQNAALHFKRICDAYNLPQMLPEDMPTPKQGESNYRSGSINEWRQVFSETQKGKLQKKIPSSLASFYDWSHS